MGVALITFGPETAGHFVADNKADRAIARLEARGITVDDALKGRGSKKWGTKTPVDRWLKLRKLCIEKGVEYK